MEKPIFKHRLPISKPFEAGEGLAAKSARAEVQAAASAPWWLR